MYRPPRSNAAKYLRRKQWRAGAVLWIIPLAMVSSFFLSCKQLSEPKAGTLYSEAVPPRKQEFRWSNGRSPKTFDPALASTPPETDIVRAIYEGLTDVDPKTLHEVPAVAEKWASSDDGRTWTFQLRKNAKWSNGDPVTARDFVSSWKRLVELGESTAHHDLFNNVVGMREKIEPRIPVVSPDPGKYLNADKKDTRPKAPTHVLSESPTPERTDAVRTEKRKDVKDIKEEQKLGVEAVSDFV
ncbi:MAG: ABC transporter substrate-binding protein, partial [Acidobacteriota bacterium]